MKDVNLNSMKTIKETFHVDIGYSDQLLAQMSQSAVAMGASVIEKQGFTLIKNLVGPDHKASLNPKELKQFIGSIRNIEIALGSYTKTKQ